MTRSSTIMLLSLFLATPSMSKSLGVTVIPTSFDVGRLSALPQKPPEEPIIAPPLVERTETDGSRMRRRGIIVGKDIAPNMTVGFGFVDRKPRKSSYSPGHQVDGSSRRSRNASMLFILKF